MSDIAAFVDLESVPFTVPQSRFLLRYTPQGEVGLYYVRYEVPLEQCLVLTLPRLPEGEVPVVGPGHVSSSLWSVAIRGNEARVSNGSLQDLVINDDHVAVFSGEDGDVILGDLTTRSDLSNKAFQESADQVVTDWMALTPSVLPARQPMTNQAWWVLGVNQVLLQLDSGKQVTAVVPSKLGYVGLWQWDAYFIALGLRHGAPQLAAEQIDIAFTPAPDGQLPDVVHEGGILASSDDLPASDIATLKAKSGTDTDELVPLTKPPLGAWAAVQVLQYLGEAQANTYFERWKDVLIANQDWWLRRGPHTPPRYEHPYSSGLDDSPVFDAGGAVISPDLLAYLIGQQEILESWDAASEPTSSATSQFLRESLESLWNDEAATYLPQHANRAPIRNRTVLSLLALFAGGLPTEHERALVSDIENPQRFAATYPLPTVAMDDPKFAADEMWRGPTWVNTTYLVAEGLEKAGLNDKAKKLRSQLLDGVEAAKGPVEYFNSQTGVKAPSATVSFGWSAALYVDLAVRESQ